MFFWRPVGRQILKVSKFVHYCYCHTLNHTEIDMPYSFPCRIQSHSQRLRSQQGTNSISNVPRSGIVRPRSETETRPRCTFDMLLLMRYITKIVSYFPKKALADKWVPCISAFWLPFAIACGRRSFSPCNMIAIALVDLAVLPYPPCARAT